MKYWRIQDAGRIYLYPVNLTTFWQPTPGGAFHVALCDGEPSEGFPFDGIALVTLEDVEAEV